MIGKEGEFQGDHFDLDFYQMLPKNFAQRLVRALHADEKIQAIWEVGFPAHKNEK